MKSGTIETQPFEVSVPKVSGKGIGRFITIPMEELNFLLNGDIKYRLGRSTEEEED